jgi:hypothetical protein
LKHIYEKGFIYRKAVETDIRKTFERVREEQKKAEEAKAKVCGQIKPKIRST